jgi:hypothetical protein
MIIMNAMLLSGRWGRTNICHNVHGKLQGKIEFKKAVLWKITCVKQLRIWYIVL